MKQTLLIALLGMSLIGCQNSGSGGNGAEKPGANTPQQFAEELATCKASTEKPNLIGNWHFSKTSDGFNETILINFSGSKMTVTNQTEYQGVYCESAGTSQYIDQATAFYLASDINSNSTALSKDGKHELSCGVRVPKGTYKYRFNGACLVISTPDGDLDLAPYNKQASPKPTSPNESVPAPGLPGNPSQPTPQPESPHPSLPLPEEPNQPAPGFPYAVIQACNSFTYEADKLTCFNRLSHLKEVDPTVARTCLSFNYSSDRRNCLEKIGELKVLHSAVKEVCESHTYSSDQMTCLKKLGNSRFDERFVEICKNQTYPSDRVSCLLKYKLPN